METSFGWWAGFGVFVVAMLALDLGVFHRRAHAIKLLEASIWVAIWVSLAMVFALGLYLGWFGDYEASQRGRISLEFLTGYLIEFALSMDNIFVFAVIFGYFAVPAQYQQKVLFLGILGALVFRLVFILVGLELIQRFEWMMYVFGALLIVTGVRLLLHKDQEIHPEKNPAVRLAKRLFPVTHEYCEGCFFVRREGRLLATPLFLVVVLLETTDVIFAVDSIPAILGVTQEPFIVYTSNVFAILGLRALYFVLASVMDMFHLLTYGLSVILILIGIKMLVGEWYHLHLPVGWSLGSVAGILVVSIVASILFPKQDGPPEPPLP